MATVPNQPARRPSPQQVFKPRASLVKFTKFYPLIIAGVLIMIVLGVLVGYYTHAWLIPVMMLMPLLSTIVGATIASRMSKSKVVLDQTGFRVLSGDVLKAQIRWNQVTRLTVRQERGDNVYEVWIKSRSIALQAAYYENGDQLLAQVSQRTNRPWERQRNPG